MIFLNFLIFFDFFFLKLLRLQSPIANTGRFAFRPTNSIWRSFLILLVRKRTRKNPPKRRFCLFFCVCWLMFWTDCMQVWSRMLSNQRVSSGKGFFFASICAGFKILFSFSIRMMLLLPPRRRPKKRMLRSRTCFSFPKKRTFPKRF